MKERKNPLTYSTNGNTFAYLTKTEMESQRLEILKHLKKGRSVTPIEALEKWGCMRLSGRIIELRKDGHAIVTEVEEKNGKRYARYRLDAVMGGGR